MPRKISKAEAIALAHDLMGTEGISANAASKQVAKGAEVSAETIRRGVLALDYSKQSRRSTIARIEQLEQQVAQLQRIVRRMGAVVPTANSSLSEDDVRAIRARYAAGEDTVALAAEYGISHTSAANIVSGRSFRHLLDEDPQQAANRVALRMGHRKLTAGQVEEIRARHRSGETVTRLAKEFKVSYQSIANIVQGRSWKVAASGELDGTRQRRKARQASGNRKLTEDQVRDIRARHAAGEPHRSIADMYGVSASTVRSIVRRRIWKDVH